MVDKPVSAKILLTLAKAKSTGEEFIGLSGTLYRQNLIFSEPRELRRINNTLELIVIFRDTDSYKKWQKNDEIIKYWRDKFSEFLSEKPKTIIERDVVIDVDKVQNCICKKSNFLILQGRSLQFVDELTCGGCLKQIPYSRVPLAISIEDWQTKYQRVYLNWLESGLFEREAYKELTNYKNGKLNLKGEKVIKELSEHFKVPVYVNHFVDESDSKNFCMVCEQKGTDSGLKFLNRICKTCNTIFNGD